MEINVESIKKAFEDNPVAFLAAAGSVLAGLGKVISAYGNSKGSRAYARQVNHRIKNSRRGR